MDSGIYDNWIFNVFNTITTFHWIVPFYFVTTHAACFLLMPAL